MHRTCALWVDVAVWGESQLHAKDLELQLAAVQVQEREEVAAGLRLELRASKESELVLHQQITQQHKKVEEVKATVAKTTEVRARPPAASACPALLPPLSLSLSPLSLSHSHTQSTHTTALARARVHTHTRAHW